LCESCSTDSNKYKRSGCNRDAWYVLNQSSCYYKILFENLDDNYTKINDGNCGLFKNSDLN
jgi:hypothetical protein